MRDWSVNDRDLLDHGRRIAELERKVAESKDAVDRLMEMYRPAG